MIKRWSDLLALYSDYKIKAELSNFTLVRRGKFHRPQFFLLSDKRLNYTNRELHHTCTQYPTRCRLQKNIFSKSNKWDARRVVLQLEPRHFALQGNEREKQELNEKRKTDYWEKGIDEARSKSQKSQVPLSNEEVGPPDLVPEPDEISASKLRHNLER